MAEFQKRWVTHLRNNSRQEPSEPNLSCPSCAEDILPDIEAFRAHVRADEPKHPTLTGDADIIEAFRKMAINPPSQRSVHFISFDSQNMSLKPLDREALRPSPQMPQNR